MPAMILDHGDVDVAQYIRDKIGYIDDVEIPQNSVLLAVYIPPAESKSAGGVLLVNQTREEYEYQGKAALVLKKGPVAFKDDAKYSFNGFDPEVGAWVVIKPSDGMKLKVNKELCVLVSDTQIKMVVPSPDMVF